MLVKNSVTGCNVVCWRDQVWVCNRWMICFLISPTIFHTWSAAMLRSVVCNAPGQISVFSLLYSCTFCLPRTSRHKMIHEDNAGDNGALATVGTEPREPVFNIWYLWLNICVKSFLHISTQLLLNASCVTWFYWSHVSVGCCRCAHPVCSSCSEAHISLSVSVAAVFSSSQMLQWLFELQGLVEGHVSDSSPASVQPGEWFSPDEISGVMLCKDMKCSARRGLKVFIPEPKHFHKYFLNITQLQICCKFIP